MHFLLVSPIFCDQISAMSSMIHGEMHQGRRVVQSLMVMENGEIGFMCMFFLFQRYCHGKLGAWTQATADRSHSTGKKGVVLYSYGDGKRASEGVVVGMAKQGDGLARLESDDHHGGLMF